MKGETIPAGKVISMSSFVFVSKQNWLSFVRSVEALCSPSIAFLLLLPLLLTSQFWAGLIVYPSCASLRTMVLEAVEEAETIAYRAWERLKAAAREDDEAVANLFRVSFGRVMSSNLKFQDYTPWLIRALTSRPT